MADRLKVLVTAGHPADALDGVGGTIAKHTDQGDWVGVVVLTHGVKTHGWALMAAERKQKASTTEDAVAAQKVVKEQEIRDGLQILGVEDAWFLHFDDGVDFTIKPGMVRKMVDILRETRPQIVITHNPLEQDGIPDQHAICGQMTVNAIRLASGVIPGHPQPPHSVMRTYFEIGSGAKTTVMEYQRSYFPHVLIDIEDTVERKVRAIDKLKSQFYDGDAGRKMTEIRGYVWGMHQRLPYVEAFQIYEPLVYSKLFVCDWDLRRASMPYEEQYRHAGRMIAPFVEQDQHP